MKKNTTRFLWDKIIISLLFLFLCVQNISAQDIQKTIQNYLEINRLKYGLSESDIKNWAITSQSFSKKIQVTHVYIRQTVNGIPISNGLANFALKNNEVVTFSNRLIKNSETKANTSTPTISAEQSIEKAATQLGITSSNNTKKTKTISSNKFIFSKVDISRMPIPVELMYFSTLDGKLVLVWDLSIKETKNSNWWSIRIDATTGVIIEKNNWTVSCTFENCNTSDHAHSTQSLPEIASTPTPPLPPTTNSHYNVYNIPTESPNHGPRTIVTDPANLTASPFGWHDGNGIDGNEFTITQGNNVFASDDSDNDDVPGYSPDGGVSLNFDYPIDLNLSPSANLDPAITNLFYMNNIMHDIWYQYGFDEESGNFQSNNYGKGGIENDYVFADAQDGGGTDNANFETPPDGSNPRMQMFLWNVNSIPDNLVINSPASIAGSYEVLIAGFGPQIPLTPITTDFVLVNDNTAPDNNDGCDPIINATDISGKIAIVKRGTCPFVDKVQAIQDVGAVAVIVINNTSNPILAMGGTDPGTITIPSVMISQADGQLILDQINALEIVNGTLSNGGGVVSGLDGDYDNVVIAHEYGHGISTRLTGGASNSDCLNNDEQMGEGWSDWFGLMLTQKSTDLSTNARGIGTYVSGDPITATGIRNAPYSTDFSINNYTYDNTNNNNVSMPHGIGFVWCTMLWDLNWAFVNQYGFDADLYDGIGGNNKLMNIVIEALKLQPCSPGFVDGRDAIIAADVLLNNGVNKCMIWEVFAKRGLGFSANQGSSASRVDQVEAFDLPVECQNGIKEITKNEISIYPNPTKNSITVDFKGKEGINKIVVSDLQGKIVFQTLMNDTDKLTIDMSKLMSGIYMLNVSGNDGDLNYKVVKE